MYYDVSAFCGHWPYRYLRGAGLREMLCTYQDAGIDGGFMSSLDAIFYNDSWEADRRLIESLAGARWRVAMAANPVLPWAENLVRQGKVAGAAAIRLYPGIHGYEPDDESAVRVCGLAAQLDMPVIVTVRMEDNRLTYLLDQNEPDMQRTQALARQCGGTRFILSNCYLNEIIALDPFPQNVWVDTAGLRQTLFPFDSLLEAVPEERVLFGSMAPLQCIQSGIINIPDHLKQKVRETNVEQIGL